MSGGVADAEARWYACYTRARAEKKVLAVLEERGIEAYLPIVPTERQWQDRRKIVDMVLFPSYIFVRFDIAQPQAVLSVPGIVGVVKADGRAIAIPEDELDAVRRLVSAMAGSDLEPEQTPYLSEGDRVEILEGPLAGAHGVVVEHRGRTRVRIGIGAIGQAWEVSVDSATLRPLAVGEEA